MHLSVGVHYYYILLSHTCFGPSGPSSGRTKYKRKYVQNILDSVQRIAPQGLQRTPPTRIAATTPELTVEILNSVF